MSEPPATELRARVEAIDALCTLPEVMLRILAIVDDDASTALDLAEEVAQDQALTAKVLRVVNSGYYGFVRQIRTIPEAVVILGFDEVERIATTIAVVNAFGADRDTLRAQRLLWRHSLACSVAAGVLEQRLAHVPGVRGAHVAGLLHDIGKAVLAQYFPELLPGIRARMRRGNLTAYEAEALELDGVSHSDIGAWVAERWNLPEALVEAIRQHHCVESMGPDAVMVHVTHAANEVCKSLGLGAEPGAPPTPLHPVSKDVAGVDRDAIVAIRDQLDHCRNLIGAVTAGAMFG